MLRVLGAAISFTCFSLTLLSILNGLGYYPDSGKLYSSVADRFADWNTLSLFGDHIEKKLRTTTAII